MADKSHLRRMHEDAIDSGQLIEAGWLTLRLAAIPTNAPPEQLEDMRNAFFAGAQHVFATLLTVMEDGDEPTEKDLRRMSLVDDELRKFVEDFAKRHRMKPKTEH